MHVKKASAALSHFADFYPLQSSCRQGREIGVMSFLGFWIEGHFMLDTIRSMHVIIQIRYSIRYIPLLFSVRYDTRRPTMFYVRMSGNRWTWRWAGYEPKVEYEYK
jgi:hypothetical protein